MARNRSKMVELCFQRQERRLPGEVGRSSPGSAAPGARPGPPSGRQVAPALGSGFGFVWVRRWKKVTDGFWSRNEPRGKEALLTACV